MKHYIIKEGSFTESGRGDYEEVARFENLKEAKSFFNDLKKHYEESNLKDWAYVKNGYVEITLEIDCDTVYLDVWCKYFD